MAIRSFRYASGFFVLSSFLGGMAFAQQAGNTSGPASGTDVQPSTAIQKETGRSSVSGPSTGAGAPGVEGKPGAESGRAPQEQTAPAK
jgi:hypothetical protein